MSNALYAELKARESISHAEIADLAVKYGVPDIKQIYNCLTDWWQRKVRKGPGVPPEPLPQEPLAPEESTITTPQLAHPDPLIVESRDYWTQPPEIVQAALGERTIYTMACFAVTGCQQTVHICIVYRKYT